MQKQPEQNIETIRTGLISMIISRYASILLMYQRKCAIHSIINFCTHALIIELICGTVYAMPESENTPKWLLLFWLIFINVEYRSFISSVNSIKFDKLDQNAWLYRIAAPNGAITGALISLIIFSLLNAVAAKNFGAIIYLYAIVQIVLNTSLVMASNVVRYYRTLCDYIHNDVLPKFDIDSHTLAYTLKQSNGVYEHYDNVLNIKFIYDINELMHKINSTTTETENNHETH